MSQLSLKYLLLLCLGLMVGCKNPLGDGSSRVDTDYDTGASEAPAAPTLSGAITQASRVDLSWVGTAGRSPSTYTVQRSTTSGSGFANVVSCVDISAMACNDTSVTPGTTYYYTVTNTNSAGSVTSNEVTVVPLQAFTISLTPGHQQIQAAFASAGATSYILQYGLSTGAYSTTISGATSPTTISSLVNGTTYYFMVTASNAAGSITATSEVSGAPNGPQPFSITAATAGNTQVALTWGASTGATSYNVRYGTSSGSYGTTFATGVTGTSSTVTGLTNGTTYYFMVTAVNASGSVNATSEVSGTPDGPQPFSITAATAGHTQVALTWGASTGATSYNVRYGTSSGSYGTTFATGVTGTSSTVTGLANGTTYYFMVTAVNASGSVNATSEVSGTPDGPQPFSITAATAGHTQVALTWGASTGATSYNVRYGTSSGSYGTTFATGVTGTSSTVTGLTNGTTYYFMVTAVNASGSVNATSEVSGTPNGPQPFSISSAIEGNAQVALTWGASTGATSYNVRYGTSSGSYGTTFATGVTGTSSTVTGLTNGTTYYFMVTAVNASGTLDATVEFVRTPALPTLSTTLDIATPTMASNWSANIPFTLGGLATFSCNGTVAATSSNTGFVANGSLVLSGTYPNCNLNVAVTGAATGSTDITLTATHGSVSVSDTFVFYVIPASTAAYSVRKLVQGYNGSALRVRRSSDSVEQDIGFLSTGGLDTSSLSTFCGVNSCFVSRWYDQSGNTRNALQTTGTSQPIIYSAGVPEVQNSRPAIRNDASKFLNSALLMGQAVGGTSAATAQFYASTIFNQSSVINSALFYSDGSGQRLLAHTTWSDGNTYFDVTNATVGQGRISANIGANATLTQLTFQRTGTTQRVFKNGTSSISSTSMTGSTPTGNTAPLQLFGNGGSMRHIGSISEIVFGNSALSTLDRQALEATQKAYFGTP
jgi:hypothetical protein